MPFDIHPKERVPGSSSGLHSHPAWRKPTVGSLVALTLLFSGNAIALSPPWYLLQRQVAAAIGADTSVLVDDLDTTVIPYRINLHVADPDKAQALASILTSHYDMGNLAVDVRVLDSNGMEVQPLSFTSGQAVADGLTAALSSNPLFVRAFTTPLSFFQRGGVGVVFNKVLLQYFSDDIGELFGNTNASAAAVFGNILIMNHGDIPLKFGTAKSELTANCGQTGSPASRESCSGIANSPSRAGASAEIGTTPVSPSVSLGLQTRVE